MAILKRKKKKPPLRTRGTPRKANEADQRRTRFVLALVLLFLGVAMGTGWFLMESVQMRGVHIEGNRYALDEDVFQFAGLDSTEFLFDIDPRMTGDRIKRHPWIQEAHVFRTANAILKIEVTERKPVLLVLDPDGDPLHYLDAEGYQMPYVKGAAFDVPLLSGFSDPYRPLVPVSNAGLLDVLRTLPSLKPELDALIAAFEIDDQGEFWLYTTPRPNRGTLKVRLGEDHFAQKASRLFAFWHQSVLHRQNIDFRWVDLRFDSQIITHETPLGQ